MKRTDPTRPSDDRGGARLVLALATLALASLVALIVTVDASAGTYRATQCNSKLGAGTGDLSFHRTSSHYIPRVACNGEGVTVRHIEGQHPTRSGRYGSWSLRSPSGARIVSANIRVSGQGRSGHRPELMIGAAHNRQRVLGRASGSLHTVTWRSAAGARSLTARLRCVKRGHCGKGRGALLALHRISLVVSDTLGPALGLGGPIFEEGARRGSETLASIASDSGGGVQRVGVEVNGRTVGSKPNRCAVKGNVALRTRPCPEHVTSSFALRTDSGPFRQGVNEVRVCASDFARDSVANRRCSHHDVRVDNLCPLSGRAATYLTAAFAGGRSRTTVRSDKHALVRGRVSDASGAPVGGARVCLATTTRGERYGIEQVVATPTTDSDGRFRTRLPKGPSRSVRIAHWAASGAALERHLQLGSKAVPSLKLRPKHTIRNGNHVRFSVRLPSPSAAHRRVEVQARSGKRWVRVARGRTGADGHWHGSYRFRATTGTRRYAFRAVAPHSKGYPFQAGRSKIRHARVKGR